MPNNITRKVLIITYYWPPAGGIGVKRWLEFSKYLKENEWEPIIYTAEGAPYPIVDDSLCYQVPENIEIHRTKVIEPNLLISKLKKNKGKSDIYKLQQQSNLDKSLIKRLLWFVRGNLFIPDARALWIKPSCKYLKKYLSENKVDAIITTGPPHSMHLIGKKLHKNFNIPWVSDFRDPWTSMDYLERMSLTPFAKKKHKKLEKDVVTHSSKVVVIGKTIQNEFEVNYGVNSVLIPNGFNPIQEIQHINKLDTKYTIVHVGSFLHNRNCDDVWECLSKLALSNKHFSECLEIKLVGNVAPSILESITKYDLNKYLNMVGLVDSITAQRMQQTAQVLLLPIDRIKNSEFVITGKMFEYLSAKRPILLVGPGNGDAAHIIKECNAGYVCHFNDYEAINHAIFDSFEKYKENKNLCNSINIEQFSYKNLTKTLAAMLNSLIKV